MKKDEMNNGEIVEKLATLGLTLYEAKAYVSLLCIGPSSGYAVAKHAGIPTAKIYETLASLAAKGFASGNGMRKATYQAGKPKEILSTMKEDVNRRIDTLEDGLGKISSSELSITASLVTGAEKIDRHVREILAAAKKKLLMTAWPQELERFYAELEKCAKRCEVMILTYGEFELPGAEIIVHRRVDLVKREVPGRMLLMAADGEQGAIASYCHDAQGSQGIFVSDEAFTNILADHFIHDASLNQLMKMLPPQYVADAEKWLTKFRNRAYFK